MSAVNHYNYQTAKISCISANTVSFSAFDNRLARQWQMKTLQPILPLVLHFTFNQAGNSSFGIERVQRRVGSTASDPKFRNGVKKKIED